MSALTKTLVALVAVLPLVVVVSACTPLQTINAFSPGTASTPTLNLAYGALARQRLDIYTPRAGQGPFPVVVFFYGGNWTSGERADYAFVGRALASRGMVALVADYRLYPEAHYPELLADSAQAVAWTIAHVGQYGGDAQRVFVMGHSAGAYNAAMVALDPALLAQHDLRPAALRGWIGLAGPYNFIPIQNPEVKPVFFAPATPADSQPINHVHAGAPPALLIAARHDKLVDPQRNTASLAASLRADGVAVTETYFDRVSHTTLVGSISAPMRLLAPTLDTIAQFVESTGAPPK